jgi:hypothetical protein
MEETFKIEHGKRGHSIISPSGASKWMGCTGSAYMEQNFGEEDQVNTFADEGTLAHEIAELIIRYNLSEMYEASEQEFMYNHGGTQQEEILQRLGEAYQHELYYQGMENDVMPYVEHVIQTVLKGSMVYLEAEGKLANIHKDMKGHIDFANYHPVANTLEIIDLKFGVGVLVEAYRNKQLMLYALGFINVYMGYMQKDKLLKVNLDKLTITLTIVQPRREHISSWIVTYAELMEFAEEAKEAADNIMRGTVTLTVGEHCRFCKAKLRCPQMVEEVDHIKLLADLQSYEMLEEDMERLLGIESVIKSFYKNLKETIKINLSKGIAYERFKLVEGRRTTVIVDPTGLEQILAENFDEDEIYEPRQIKGITALKSVLGAKKFRVYVEPFTTKTKGNATVAGIDDKRSGVQSSAALDFEDL